MLERTLGNFVLCFGWLAPAASAQGGGFHQGYIPPPPVPQPPPPSPYADAVFGDMVVGEFTGDLGLDAVVMDDGEPALLMSPEVFITKITNDDDPPLTGNDIATYRFAGATHDVLLLAGANGIQKLVYSGPTGPPWGATTLQSGTTPLNGTSAWGGARAVRTGSFGWTSATDIVGLASAAYPAQVLALIATPAGSFVAGAGVMVGGPAYGLEVIDWNGSGFDKIAVLTSLGIEIWGTTAGSFQDGYSWTSSPIVVAVLHDDIPSGDGGGDRLAFVLTGEEQYVGVFDRFGVEELQALGDAGIVSATARDTDGDGDEDLFLTSNTETAFLVLENTEEEYTFDVGNPDHTNWVEFGDQERDPSVNEAGLAIGDFDGDTDLDILAPAQGDGTVDGRVHLLRNDLVDHREWLTLPTGSHFFLDQSVSPVTSTLTLSLAQPAELLTGGELKVTVWSTDDHEEFTTVTPFESVQYLSLGASSFSFHPDETSIFEYSTIYTVVIRQVVRDGGGNVIQQKPATIILNASEENYDEIIGQVGSESPQLQANEIKLANGDIPDTRSGGGYVIGPEVPPPPPDPDPRPDPAS